MKVTGVFILLFYAVHFTATAQKLEMKKNIISINEKEILSYKTKAIGIEYSIYKLHSDEEVINYYSGDTFNTIYFNCLDKKVKIEKYFNTVKEFIKCLYNEKVFDNTGNLNINKINIFISKHIID